MAEVGGRYKSGVGRGLARLSVGGRGGTHGEERLRSAGGSVEPIGCNMLVAAANGPSRLASLVLHPPSRTAPFFAALVVLAEGSVPPLPRDSVPPASQGKPPSCRIECIKCSCTGAGHNERLWQRSRVQRGRPPRNSASACRDARAAVAAVATLPVRSSRMAVSRSCRCSTSEVDSRARAIDASSSVRAAPLPPLRAEDALAGERNRSKAASDMEKPVRGPNAEGFVGGSGIGHEHAGLASALRATKLGIGSGCQESEASTGAACAGTAACTCARCLIATTLTQQTHQLTHHGYSVYMYDMYMYM